MPGILAADVEWLGLRIGVKICSWIGVADEAYGWGLDWN